MRNDAKPTRLSGLLTFGLLAVAALTVESFFLRAAAAQELALRLYRVESYTPEFPAKRVMNRRYRPQLNALKREMQKRMREGENLTCASQIFEEAHWLTNYTNRSEEIERRIHDLRDALEKGTVVTGQDPRDGSFGTCFETWLWRFFRSVDPLKELAKQGRTPEVALKIWEPIDSPEELKALMRSLLISDLEKGHNKRKELNLAITALGQLLWLDYTASVFPKHLDREALAKALREFVDEEWQDPETGYWGAWYRDGGEIRRTNDLSITFHIISYRDGMVGRRDQIAQTTFAIHRHRYPYGWQTGGTQNNHHAYDIARMINFTWDEMKASERAAGRAALFIMMSRSLALSIDDRGDFDPEPYTTLGEAYYFGISFLAELGLFGNDTRREVAARIENTEPLLAQIRRNLDRLDPSDPWVRAAKRKLAEIAH